MTQCTRQRMRTMSTTLVVLAAALIGNQMGSGTELAACAAARAGVADVLRYPIDQRPTVMDVESPSFDRRGWSAREAVSSVTRGFRSVVRYQVPVGSPANDKAPPRAETSRALWAAADNDPRVDCPSFKPFAASLGLQFIDEQQAEQISKVGADGYYHGAFVHITTPVLNAEQTEGLAFYSRYAGPLAGGTFLLLLRKASNGDWRVTLQLPMSIS